MTLSDDPPTSATDELRAAHDVLAPVYRERLAGLLEQMPYERAVLDLFAEWTRDLDGDPAVADIGCGTGRLAPYLAGHGLLPRGLDLSPEMIRVAQTDHPGFVFEVGDVRRLPYEDGELAGALGWYSLMYLPPEDRDVAYAELARVIRPGGHLVIGYKAGDDTKRRGGQSLDLGIGFDIWWHSQGELERLLDRAGFDTVFWAGRPGEEFEPQPQGYLIARRRGAGRPAIQV